MPSAYATPRLTRGKPRFRTLAAIGRVHSHSVRPLLMSIAWTAVGPAVAYITPLTTIGVVSSEPAPGGWYTHTGFSFATFDAVICASGEKRSDRYLPEYIGHSPVACWAASGAAATASAARIARVISHLAATPGTRPDRRGP